MWKVSTKHILILLKFQELEFYDDTGIGWHRYNNSSSKPGIWV
jgi:hypothetical protein